MEVSISHHTDTEVQETDNLWEIQKRNREDIEDAMRKIWNRNNRSKCMQRSHSHVSINSTENVGIQSNGNTERKECIDDI